MGAQRRAYGSFPPWLRWLLIVAAVAAGAAFAPEVLGPYYMRVTILSVMFFCLALGYNVIVTEAGLFHLGVVVYFAVGAYTVAIATTAWNWSFWSAMALMVVVVLVFTLALGVLLLRFRGDYLSVVSLAVAEVLRLLAANWRSVTGGYQGIPGVPPPEFFGRVLYEQQYYLYMLIVLAMTGVAVLAYTRQSGIGLAWRGIRQNERALRSVGIHTDLYKQLAFVVGGMLSGTAGAIYASYQTIVDPSLVAIDGTIVLLTIVILSGGSVVGLFLSATVLTVMPEVMRVFEEYRLLLLGIFFVVMMNFWPDGFTRRAPPAFVREDAPAGTKALLAVRPTRAESVLRAADVSVHFGGLVALDRVSLEVRKGEILGLIGPNGAGKTTLFNVIAGALRPQEGTVLYEGVALGRASAERRSRLGIARTFQTIEFCPTLTCLENVMLARLPRRRRGGGLSGPTSLEAFRREEVARALAALAFVGIGDKADLAAGSLSYGDRRRLEIGRALASEPTLMLLDEPAAGMNPAEALALAGLIRDIRDMGVTVLLIEHNVRLVRSVCDRLVVLASGQVIAAGDPETVSRDSQVIEAYLGRRAHGIA